MISWQLPKSLRGAGTSTGTVRIGIGLSHWSGFRPKKSDLHKRWAPALGTFVGPSTKAPGSCGDVEASWILEQTWFDYVFSLRNEGGLHFRNSIPFQDNAVSRQSVHSRDVRYKRGVCFYRRKFRSQTSDNMDRWKSRGGKSQRGEERREKIIEEKEWEERRCRCAKRWDSMRFSSDLWLGRIEK